MTPASINAQLDTLARLPAVRMVLLVTDDERGTIGAGFFRPDLNWRDVTAAQLALDRAQERIEAQDAERLNTRKTFGDIK